jgi:hypothetical protein
MRGYGASSPTSRWTSRSCRRSYEKRSEGCQAARAGSLDAGALQYQRASIMPLGVAAALGLGTQRARHAIKARCASASVTSP